MKILIVGAGMAGLCSAYWCKRAGFDVTIIEKHADFMQHKGYMIDFFGPGLEVAEKMQLGSAIKAKDTTVDSLITLNKTGKQTSKLPFDALRDALGGKVYSMLRGDLEDILYDALDKSVQVRAGLTIKQLQQYADRVDITFSDGQAESFDLVIGADGIHSQVRELVFGPEQQFAIQLDHTIAAYIIEREKLKDAAKQLKNDFYSFMAPGKQLNIYPVDDNRLATFIVFKDAGQKHIHDNQRKKQLLQDKFKDFAWLAPEILAAADPEKDFLFDSLTQIAMPEWHQGRVVLVGDACQCLTLMAGQGASMAMAGAYVLAGELDKVTKENGDYTQAFKNYQAQMQADILCKQKEARNFVTAFVPGSQLGIQFRNLFMKLLTIPWLSNWYVKRFTKGGLQLKDYSIV